MADAPVMQRPSDPSSGSVRGPDSRLDIREGPSSAAGERPWLSVFFKCSGHYQRVFRNVEGTAYLARCPKCGKSMRFLVGEGGSSQRFFEVGC